MKNNISTPKILIVGTCDTKSDELLYIKHCIESHGATATIMDVGVLGDPSFIPDISKHEIAEAAHTTNQDIIDLGNENAAMTKTAEGACVIVKRLYDEGKIDGLIALGGTMATDLALDVVAVLPANVAKYIVSTVAFSHLIPPERITPDLMMILWSGGLYGLNSVCKTSLAQAAGAVVGAARANIAISNSETFKKPKIAMSSLGKSCLKYMVALKPEIERRGFELVVFHTTGMNGAAMESMILADEFVAVLDFSLQEISNHIHKSVVTAGPDRMTAASRMKIPQIIAPGAVDMVDLATWTELAPHHRDRLYHAHNRLIANVTLNADERREVARTIAHKLKNTTSACHFIMPTLGIEEWDKKGGDMHDADAHQAFVNEANLTIKPLTQYSLLNAHINDPAFADKVLEIFDGWLANGTIENPLKPTGS